MSTTHPPILLSEFSYDLPQERIAQEAVEPRDSSKLLIYQDGEIKDSVFRELVHYLPEGASLFFNNARVIPARIHLNNKNGARIEVFLLQPHLTDYASALNATTNVRWQCLIGNQKKWKNREVLSLNAGGTLLELSLYPDQVVEFMWRDGILFSDVLEKVGKLPLPPYIHHEADDTDLSRYQTVYSKVSGSVAAPTAGLHFTDRVLAELDAAGFERNEVTLHVSAGTFLPVKAENALEHDMHEEVFEVNRELISRLGSGRPFVCVGTTACRVMESLWLVASAIRAGRPEPLVVTQFAYNEFDHELSRAEVAEILLSELERSGSERMVGSTKIMIVPGFKFRMTDALITNFHQPGSTLLMLIEAFVGKNRAAIYQHALSNGYRFLSYGDSSLLIR